MLTCAFLIVSMTCHASLFQNRPWVVIVCDEVHTIKSPTSKMARAMKKFKERRRIGMTGTILQNSYSEYWSVLDWVVPGMLGEQKLFTKDFVTPLEDGHVADATDEQLAARRLAQNELNDRISHMHLRRTKELIKDQLPKKIDRIVFCPLTRVRTAMQMFCVSETRERGG